MGMALGPWCLGVTDQARVLSVLLLLCLLLHRRTVKAQFQTVCL